MELRLDGSGLNITIRTDTDEFLFRKNSYGEASVFCMILLDFIECSSENRSLCRTISLGWYRRFEFYMVLTYDAVMEEGSVRIHELNRLVPQCPILLDESMFNIDLRNKLIDIIDTIQIRSKPMEVFE